MTEKHKAGFVNIIGKPNVGKSTLMNVLLGEKLSITTSKAQTTRHRIMGIANDDNYQLIFSDTPGIIKPSYKLHEIMMKNVNEAFIDADVLLFVTDIYSGLDDDICEKLKKTTIPLFCIINKIDQNKGEEILTLYAHIQKELPSARIYNVSALKSTNTTELYNDLIQTLPEHPPYFDKDTFTDRPLRFFVTEIIREKILLLYKKEIPYSTQIEIDEYRETDELDYIRAIIYVVRKSQKGIIIGHNGQAIKKLGIEARKDIESFIDKKVYLELFVKVNEDWRDNDKKLSNFGYE